METVKRKRGRPIGSGTGPTGPTGPRVGSRPHKLLSLKPGHRLFLEAPAGRLQPFMQQVAADIHRNGLAGLVSQSHIIGVQVSSREVIDLVMVTRG